MNIKLESLLPAEISDEAAFHLIQFTRSLSMALETIYFDKMLKPSNAQNGISGISEAIETGDDPF